MTDRITLPYIASDAIQEFLRAHPVDRTNSCLGLPGQIGNKKTPTLAMEEFWRLLLHRGTLFTQEEYVTYALMQWAGWQLLQDAEVLEAIKARLRCNFYISGVQTLHVWAMLVETGLFHTCVIDSVLDAFKSIDVFATSRDGKPITVALMSASAMSKKCRQMKDTRPDRSGPLPEGAIVCGLPDIRPCYPGNMRWYTIDDLRPVLERTGENATLAIARWKKAHGYSAIQGEFW